jgi:hypothetical protein
VQLHEKKRETGSCDCTASDEGVGIREQLVRVPFNSVVCDQFPQEMGRQVAGKTTRQRGPWPRRE